MCVMSKIDFDFYYGVEAEQFSFVRIPRVLFTDKDNFGDLSNEAKLLYGLLLERMELSRKNNWIDEHNRVYIIFKIEEIADRMNCGHEKACNILKELDDENGIGLISKKRRGMGQPAIIYVKNFIIAEQQSNEPVDKSTEYEDKQQENYTKTRLPKIRNQEIGKSEVLTSENQTSRLPKNRLQKVGKSDDYFSYIDMSYIEDQSINQSGAGFDKLEFIKLLNIIKKINNTLNNIKNLFIFNCWSNISIMTKYYVVNIIAIHMMQKNTCCFIGFSHITVTATY